MKSLRMNRNQIKYLVIVAMLMDHMAMIWVPRTGALYQAMRFFGRLTDPTMVYFLVEGYLHTRSVKRYALRLTLFALLSWPAFCLFRYGVLPVRVVPGDMVGAGIWLFYIASRNETLIIYPFFGVIYTLLLSLLAVWLYDSKAPRPVKFVGILALLWFSRYGDWPYFDVLWALVFFICRDKPWLKWASYCVIGAFVYFLYTPWQTQPLTGIFHLGIFVVPLLLLFGYNGQSGSKKAIHKWFFYIFYPAHLLLLAFLRFGI